MINAAYMSAIGRTIAFAMVLAVGMTNDARGQASSDARTSLSGQVEIARLVDLCTQRLGLKIEYDTAVLKGNVTLRLGGPLSDEELWAMTNRVLATRGFATVRLPGADDKTFSVVKLADASGMAAVQSAQSDDENAGYVSLITRVNHQSVKSIVDAVKNVLSKPGGAIVDLGSGNLVLISDLRPRVYEALNLIQSLDIPGGAVEVLTVHSKFVGGAQLAPLVTTASAAGDAMTTAPPRKGKIMAASEADAVIVICPSAEVKYWRSLIERFDQRQPVQTKSYSAGSFAGEDVARLIEQTSRDLSPRGAADQWRLVSDELTGTLIVTATPPEHEKIAELVARLEAMPAESRRPMRVFMIHNRSVSEIIKVLNQMLEAGVLESSATDSSRGPESTIAPEIAAPTSVQTPGSTTTRPPQPPAPGIPGTAASSPMPPTSGMNEARRTDRLGASAAKVSNAAQGGPRITLTADEGTNALIAVAESRTLNQIAELILALDVRQPQVMVEVLIVSLSDTDTLDLGVELRKIEISGATTISLSSLFGLGTTGTGPPPASVNAGTGFTGVVLSPGDFSVVLRALQTVNKGRVLSLPKVLVNNNQQATLNSVLQQPFVSVNASDTIATTSFGGSENAGTIITIKPQIAQGDHLLVQYSVSLSSFVGDAIDPTVPPPKQSNTLSSLVTIPDGYTVVVGGLEITNETKGVSQIPLLGSIPILGEAFKNRSITSSRSRFFVFIRSDVMRHTGFEDLKYLSDQDAMIASVDDGWPEVEPRVIK